MPERPEAGLAPCEEVSEGIDPVGEGQLAVVIEVGDPVASGIAVANGVLFFTAVASGKLVALDSASGRVLKEIELGPVWSGPSVSRGRVYVGTGNTQFTPSDKEAFFPKKDTGVLYSFGLPGDDATCSQGRRISAA